METFLVQPLWEISFLTRMREQGAAVWFLGIPVEEMKMQGWSKTGS